MSAFDQFCAFLQDHRVFVAVVCGLLLLYYVPVLCIALFSRGAPSRAPIRRSPGKVLPPATPVPPSASKPRPSPATDGGDKDHLGSALDQAFGGIDDSIPAKSLNLPVSPSKSTHGEAAQLEARIERDKSSHGEAPSAAASAPSSGEAPVESQTKSIRRKATRMEELGFHVGIQSDAVPGAAGTPAVPDKPLPGIPAARTETAELTSILERIDKFLAEDQPGTTGPATAGAGSHPPSPPVASAPVSATGEGPANQAGQTAAAEPSPAQPPAEQAPSETPARDAPKDGNKDGQKTKPLWARSDVQDEDVEPGSGDKEKGKGPAEPGEGGQQRLF